MCPILCPLLSNFTSEVSSTATAVRRAVSPMWPYRLAMIAVVAADQPRMVATTESGAPPSSIRVQAVCRMSWNRAVTSAARFAVAQAVFQLPMGWFGLRA